MPTATDAHRNCSGASACLTTPSIDGSKANADDTGRNSSSSSSSSSGPCGDSGSGNAGQLGTGAHATQGAGAAIPPGSAATPTELHAYALPLQQSGVLLGAYLRKTCATVERQRFTNTPELHALLTTFATLLRADVFAAASRFLIAEEQRGSRALMSPSATLAALLPVHQLVNMAAEAPSRLLLACVVLEALEGSSYLAHGCRYALQSGAGSSRTRWIEDMLAVSDNVLSAGRSAQAAIAALGGDAEKLCHWLAPYMAPSVQVRATAAAAAEAAAAAR